MNRETARQAGFWILALSWLPAAVITRIVNYAPFQSGPLDWVQVLRWEAPMIVYANGGAISASPIFGPMVAAVVVIFAYISVLPALLCRQLWRLGYRRSAWIAGIAIAIATVFVIGGTSDGLEDFNYDLIGMMFFLPVWTALYMALFSLLLCAGIVLISRRN